MLFAVHIQRLDEPDLIIRNETCFFEFSFIFSINLVYQINPQQIAELITRNRRELSRFISRKLGTADATADLLQDAYLRLAGYQSAVPVVNLRAFMFRTVSNLVVDHQRRSVNRIPHETDDEMLHAVPDNQPVLETRIQAGQGLERLALALDELPDKCREVFYLNRVEGYTHKEIAERLHLSESMVAKYLVRAMRHCRERLKENDFPV